MNRKTVWRVVSGLMVLSLVIVGCGQQVIEQKGPAPPPVGEKKATPVVEEKKQQQEAPVKEAVKPTAVVPKHGGTITFDAAGDQSNWDPARNITGRIIGSLYQQLWEGDWAKGPAGGYGTNEVDWGMGNNDLFDFKMGFLAESTKWTFDTAKNQGAIVYQVRRGVHWGLNPKLEASRLVNGREMTTDDVIAALKRSTNDPLSYIYLTNIELRNLDITKTGPWEITVKVPLEALFTAIIRFGDSIFIGPPEVPAKFGDMIDWKRAVGTGPFLIDEYVAGSAATLIRNPNYWMKDPVGPGKGNQLPYVDKVKILILPDLSTRQAAFRTGKVDYMGGFNWEEAGRMRQQVPVLLEKMATSLHGRGSPLLMRIDKAPFSDIRVRKAMMMAVDYEAMLKGLYNGVGQILTYPASKITPYAELYLDLDAPDFPESAKELYKYNPEKSKQLLKEAGYPNGFKTEVLITSGEADYYSIIKDYFSKVGIDLALDIREGTVKSSIARSRTHNAMSTATTGPIAQFTSGFTIQGVSQYNLSMIDDPVINKAMIKIRLAALTDMREAMRLYREEIFKYIVTQAYAVPNVIGPNYKFWWPWLKNYSGEEAVGYDDYNWQQWIWIDQDLKKKMGY